MLTKWKHKHALVADHLTVIPFNQLKIYSLGCVPLITICLHNFFLYLKKTGFVMDGRIYTGFIMEGQNSSLEFNTSFVIEGHIIIQRVTLGLSWRILWKFILWRHVPLNIIISLKMHVTKFYFFSKSLNMPLNPFNQLKIYSLGCVPLITICSHKNIFFISKKWVCHGWSYIHLVYRGRSSMVTCNLVCYGKVTFFVHSWHL